MKISKSVTNFTSGELSPRLLGRSDLKKYHNGCSTLENCLVQTHGGLERRPGTQYVAEAHGTVVTGTPPRLIEFQYSVEQSYVLEFGVTSSATTGDTGYIRFFRLSSDVPTLLTDATASDNPTILSSLQFNASELNNLKFTQSADALFVFCPTRPVYRLNRTNSVSTADSDAGNWAYVIHEHKDGPYLPMNSSDVTLHASGSTGDVTVTASAATFVTTDAATHADNPTDIGRVLRIEDDSTGYDITDFSPGTYDHSAGATFGLYTTAATITVNDDGAMAAIAGTGNQRGKRIEFLKIAQGLTILNDTVWVAKNFSLVGGDSKFELYHPTTGEKAGFRQEDATSFLEGSGKCRFERASSVGWGRIKAYTSATVVTLEVIDELPIGADTDHKTTNWRWGAWSEATGYPSTGTFYQDRLWTANTTEEPQTLWSSGTGNYNCYSPNTIDKQQVLSTSAMTVTLADRQVNEINQIEGDSAGLIILTSGGEWLGRASSPTAALSPTDLSFQKQSNYGSGDIQLCRIGGSILTPSRDGKVVRELSYDYTQDRFNAPAVTLLSEHITGSGLTDSAAQLGKTNMAWFVRSDGVLINLTYERSEEVMAWQRQPLALSNSVAATAISVGVTRDTGYDNVWLLVKRNINGSNKYFIEMLKAPYEATDAHNTAFYLDCGKLQTGSASQTWGNLNHLIGEAVYVLADAATLGPFTVNGSGQIDLGSGNTPTTVVAGLRYKSVMETMPIIPDATTSLKNPRGKLKRAFKYFINMYKSLGGKVGTPDQLYAIEYPAATSTALNTKMFEFNAPDNSDRETIIRYEQEDSQPATILSIVSEFDHGTV